MSTREDYLRRNELEQNPALLHQVERIVTPTAAGLKIEEGGRINGNAVGKPPQPADEWPEPEPLGGELPAVPAFDLETMLPLNLRPLAKDISERMQAPIDLPAMASVVTLSGAAGRRVRIFPKEKDYEWEVVVNLWGAIIGPPGVMKSPIMEATTRPLLHLEKLYYSEFEAELSDYELEKEKADLRLAAWKAQYTAAQKDPPKDEPVRPDNTIAKPVLKRLVGWSCTIPARRNCTKYCRRIRVAC